MTRRPIVSVIALVIVVLLGLDLAFRVVSSPSAAANEPLRVSAAKTSRHRPARSECWHAQPDHAGPIRPYVVAAHRYGELVTAPVRLPPVRGRGSAVQAGRPAAIMLCVRHAAVLDASPYE